jgi:hypothetical protein
MHALIRDVSLADKWFFDVTQDLSLITHRAIELARNADPIVGIPRDERREIIRVIDRVGRLIHRWEQKSISREIFTAAVRRERLRLIPNEPARNS